MPDVNKIIVLEKKVLFITSIAAPAVVITKRSIFEKMIPQAIQALPRFHHDIPAVFGIKLQKVSTA